MLLNEWTAVPFLLEGRNWKIGGAWSLVLVIKQGFLCTPSTIILLLAPWDYPPYTWKKFPKTEGKKRKSEMLARHRGRWLRRASYQGAKAFTWKPYQTRCSLLPGRLRRWRGRRLRQPPALHWFREVGWIDPVVQLIKYGLFPYFSDAIKSNYNWMCHCTDHEWLKHAFPKCMSNCSLCLQHVIVNSDPPWC